MLENRFVPHPFCAIYSEPERSKRQGVLSVLKLGVFALLVFAVMTASPADKMAMYEGSRAFVNAVYDACTRASGPCVVASRSISRFVGDLWAHREPLPAVGENRGVVRELDGTPRRPVSRPYGVLGREQS